MKLNILNFRGPDGISQETVEYHDVKPARVRSFVIASHHTEEAVDKKRGLFLSRQT